MGQLITECQQAVGAITQARYDESDHTRISRADSIFTSHMTLWGPTNTAKLNDVGAFYDMMPRLVKLLSPVMQRQSLEYWSELVKTYLDDHEGTTPRRIKELLMKHTSTVHTSMFEPSCEFVALMNDDSPLKYDRCREIERKTGCSRRMFTHPDELSITATSALLFLHWPTFVCHLIGHAPGRKARSDRTVALPD